MCICVQHMGGAQCRVFPKCCAQMYTRKQMCVAPRTHAHSNTDTDKCIQEPRRMHVHHGVWMLIKRMNQIPREDRLRRLATCGKSPPAAPRRP